jgi:protein TonB
VGRAAAIFAIVLGVAYSLSAAEQSQAQNNSAKDSDQVYVAGGDVKPPRVIHYVEPASSPSSQDAYVEGVVRISAIVNLDGAPAELQVTKGLNAEEDKLAIEALKQWRFKPGTKNERPVRVKINVEINFHLL